MKGGGCRAIMGNGEAGERAVKVIARDSKLGMENEEQKGRKYKKNECILGDGKEGGKTVKKNARLLTLVMEMRNRRERNGKHHEF